ncbi:MAG: OmpA family protein [Ignavibacteriaceae bacterium]|nr:OmpA family protein [Ignavibacteriaceae bacterium]
MKNGENNIIIVKKGKKHEGHHGGAWKVAYADFVTAMMALFIVLWVLGQDQKIVQGVAGYFKDPVGFSTKSKFLFEGSGIMPSDSANQVVKKIKDRQEEINRLKEMGDQILDELSENSEFAKLTNQVKVEIVKEGLRIEMTESNDAVFFEIGTSELKNEARKLLETLGNNLSTIPNKIIIEGHTDSRPYSNEKTNYSNFELSCDRANSARRVLISGGLNTTQIDEVRGYADSRLLDKTDPYNLVNRRISVTIKFASDDPS